MNHTKKDKFGNDIFWYVLGDEADDWLESLQDVFNPVPLERFAESVKHDLETKYNFTQSQLDFASEQLNDAEVITALFEHYQDRLPKFSGKHIARSPELIWGAGNTKASCMVEAEHWWGINAGSSAKFSEAGIVPYEASDRAYDAIKERGADAERDVVEVFDSLTRKTKYCHVSEVPETVH